MQFREKSAMSRQQELVTKDLLKDAFQGTVTAKRYQTNQLASKTMARFTVILFSVISMLLLKCWF